MTERDQHRDQHREHDGLRDRLRAVDPAASLGPADPTRVARLLEDTMSNDVDTPVERRTGTHGRSPLTWLVAAAAVVLIAAVGAFTFLGRDGDSVPAARDTPAAGASSDPGPSDGAAADGSVTELTMTASGQGRCALPTAAIIGNQAVAFEGTVTSVGDDGTVTLDPTEFFAGDPTDEVRVEAPSASMVDLVGAVEFAQGESYLVSATDGQVSLCGLSGPATRDLMLLYQAAFPSR